MQPRRDQSLSCFCQVTNSGLCVAGEVSEEDPDGCGWDCPDLSHSHSHSLSLSTHNSWSGNDGEYSRGSLLRCAWRASKQYNGISSLAALGFAMVLLLLLVLGCAPPTASTRGMLCERARDAVRAREMGRNSSRGQRVVFLTMHAQTKKWGRLAHSRSHSHSHTNAHKHSRRGGRGRIKMGAPWPRPRSTPP